MRAYEIEPVLVEYLSAQLDALRATGAHAELTQRDFIREGAFALSFGGAIYSHVILNPPYKKIGASSEYRLLLRQFGIETVNLYTAFLGLYSFAHKKEARGEIVAIVPRSFCNGTYFRPFRQWLLQKVSIRRIHVFESRAKAFKDDDVLQEKYHHSFRVRSDPRGSHNLYIARWNFNDQAQHLITSDEIVRPG